MPYVRINVTEVDIREGLRCHPTRSPIALAMSRAAKEKIVVGPTYWRFADQQTRYGLPEYLINWNRGFDRGITQMPMSVHFNSYPIDEDELEQWRQKRLFAATRQSASQRRIRAWQSQRV